MSSTTYGHRNRLSMLWRRIAHKLKKKQGFVEMVERVDLKDLDTHEEEL